MIEIPSIGDPVVLRDEAGLHYASRVEDIGDETIVVARPADLRAALVYDIGLALELIWTVDTGIHVLPTELAATSVDRNIRLWHLAITGDGWAEQRRDYVRVPASGRIVIAPDGSGDDTDGEEAIVGTLVDLSEVAVLVTVPVPPGDHTIRVGTAVRCRFALGVNEYDLRGTIIIVRATSTPRESRLVIRFLESRVTADALRKEIFAIQIARRRQSDG